MKGQPYPEYKNSGIEWLGKIPENWRIVRLKYCSKINMGQSPSSDDCNCYGVGIPFLQGTADFGPVSPIPKQYCEKPPKIAHKGDFLISVRAPVGEFNVANQDYGIGRGLCGIMTDSSFLQPSFCQHLLDHVRIQLYSEAAGSTYDAVSVDEIGNMLVLIPPLPEQLAVASYLSCKTANIDGLIAAREQQVILLKEKREAIISSVSTRGLDSTVHMKDSGIEWLREIPEHWTTVRSRFVFKEVDERSTSGEEELLTVSHITGVTPRSEKNVNMFMADTLEGYKKCKAGDLIINTMWAWMGALGTASQDGVVSPSYNVYRLRDPGYDPRYYDRLFRTRKFETEITRFSKGVWKSRLRLYPDGLFQIRIPCPPKNEQVAIADYLDQKTDYVDKLKMKIQWSIEKLREYRVSLISAAVTGKIDLRKEVS